MQSQSHVKWECNYHIVIVPKYRKKVLFGQTRSRLREILRELAKRKGIKIIEGHVMPDHVHMMLSIPPKYSVAHTIGYLKGKSAIWLHNEFGNKKSIRQKSFWSTGYFVRTVGLDQETVQRYIQDQEKKDKHEDGDQLDLQWN
jgi:putative transposase